MKIVFDTNVLISAAITQSGLASHLMLRVFHKHTVILSDYILAEFQTKLIHKIAVPPSVVDRALHYLKIRAKIFNPESLKGIEFKDPKDRPILALVKAVSADYLITGDKALIELRKFEGTFILSPREAMERI